MVDTQNRAQTLTDEVANAGDGGEASGIAETKAWHYLYASSNRLHVHRSGWASIQADLGVSESRKRSCLWRHYIGGTRHSLESTELHVLQTPHLISLVKQTMFDSYVVCGFHLVIVVLMTLKRNVAMQMLSMFKWCLLGFQKQTHFFKLCHPQNPKNGEIGIESSWVCHTIRDRIAWTLEVPHCDWVKCCWTLFRWTISFHINVSMNVYLLCMCLSTMCRLISILVGLVTDYMKIPLLENQRKTHRVPQPFQWVLRRSRSQPFPLS